jgi:hypothetical protein
MRPCSHSRLCAALLATLLVHCTPRQDHREPEAPLPPPAAPTAGAASAVDAGQPAPAPAPEVEGLGRFRLRIAISASPELVCLPGFTDADVLENGQVWLSGTCGIRVRVDAAGKLEDFRAPWTTVKYIAHANVRGACPATAAFWGLLARSESEVFVVGDTRCETDGLWYRPLEKFDGKRWISTQTRFDKDPLGTFPSKLAGDERELYTLVEGDPWTGPPACSVHRLGKNGWSKAELSCPMPMRPQDRVLLLKGLDVARDGTLWVAGAVVREQVQSGMVWSRRKPRAAWTEISVEDPELHSVSVADDGSVWLAGNSLWRLDDSAFVRLTASGNQPIASVWAQNQSEAWITTTNGPRWFSGGRDVAVPIDPAEGPFDGRIDGAGKHIWVVSNLYAWRLERGDAPPAVHTLSITEPNRGHNPPESR